MTRKAQSPSRSAVRENHLEDRQNRLRARAVELAQDLARDTTVQLVWLTGSVAKGNVDEASDLDLHVFATDPLRDRAAWRFLDRSAPENLHVFQSAVIDDGAARQSAPGALAEWMHRTGIADALTGASCLYEAQGAGSLKAALDHIVALRGTAAHQRALAIQFAEACRDLALKAQAAMADGATLDAHQTLRRASQELLVGHLIARGWVLRGSKKRPEIATAFGLDEEESGLMTLFYEVNGLSDLSPAAAAAICRERLEFRAVLSRVLRRAAYEPPTEAQLRLIQDYEAHNAGAADYYAPLVRDGIYKGPVNHIRSFSGFGHLPALVLQFIGAATPHPVTAWSSWGADHAAAALAQWESVSALSQRAQLVSGFGRRLVAAADLSSSVF